MDTRLLKHYETELAFLREMGAEFANAYPKIASRLGMEGIEVVDPYVERLLEGSAFLAARVQLELDMQFPTFTSNLLEIVYPHYLAPTPSMMVAPSCFAKLISSESDRRSSGVPVMVAKVPTAGGSDTSSTALASPTRKMAPRFSSDMRKAQRRRRRTRCWQRFPPP